MAKTPNPQARNRASTSRRDWWDEFLKIVALRLLMRGGENRARGAFLLFGVAILIAGCAGLKQARELQEADDYLRSAKTLLRQRDFDGALRENEKALALAQGLPPADEVVFNIGVIYTQSEYAGKDEQKAAGYFEQVMTQYPESRFAAWAKVWLAMIREGEDAAVKVPEFELKLRRAR